MVFMSEKHGTLQTGLQFLVRPDTAAVYLDWRADNQVEAARF
jgi:hypothetical protein